MACCGKKPSPKVMGGTKVTVKTASSSSQPKPIVKKSNPFSGRTVRR